MFQTNNFGNMLQLFGTPYISIHKDRHGDLIWKMTIIYNDLEPHNQPTDYCWIDYIICM